MCCCFFSVCLSKPASKRSRRMRRYVKTITMNLQRAQMSTRWTTMKTTAARRGPTFISIVCLLSDCEVQVLRFESASLTACVTLKRFQKQQLHLHNQTLSSWGFLIYLSAVFLFYFYFFWFFNLAFNSFCTVEWDHKNTYVKLFMIYLILYLYTEGPWWADRPKQREHQ